MVEKNLTIPRGLVFFKKTPSESNISEWVNLGNCPDVSLTISETVSKQVDSVNGQLVVSDIFRTMNQFSFSITTDNMGWGNLILFSGFENQEQESDLEKITETFDVSEKYIFLSKRPLGTMSIMDNNSSNWDGFDFTYDPDGNFIKINPTVRTGSATSVSVIYYAPSVAGFKAVESFGSVEGSLKIVGTNPVGPKRNYTFSRVRISAKSELQLIASPEAIDWSKVTMLAEVMKPTNATDLFTVEEFQPSVMTLNGMVLVDSQNRAISG